MRGREAKERETERQTDSVLERKEERQTDSVLERKEERQTDRQTEFAMREKDVFCIASISSSFLLLYEVFGVSVGVRGLLVPF